jgi:Peptidase M50B-like
MQNSLLWLLSFSTSPHHRHHTSRYTHTHTTSTAGGCRAIVIPAGYVGAAFWGGAFVALSGNRIGATVIAGIICAFLLVSLWYVLH